MTQSPFARAGIGFLVAAASVLVFHQGMIFVLKTAGLVNAPIYGTNPVGPLGVPLIVNQMFWGGLYGAAFGALLPRLPRPPIAPGLVLGLIAGLVSMFVVAPIKGNPVGAGWQAWPMARNLRINGTWGLGVGLIWTVLLGRMRER
jgi:hypothetical protein